MISNSHNNSLIEHPHLTLLSSQYTVYTKHLVYEGTIRNPILSTKSIREKQSKIESVLTWSWMWSAWGHMLTRCLAADVPFSPGAVAAACRGSPPILPRPAASLGFSFVRRRTCRTSPWAAAVLRVLIFSCRWQR